MVLHLGLIEFEMMERENFLKYLLTSQFRKAPPILIFEMHSFRGRDRYRKKKGEGRLFPLYLTVRDGRKKELDERNYNDCYFPSYESIETDFQFYERNWRMREGIGKKIKPFSGETDETVVEHKAGGNRGRKVKGYFRWFSPVSPFMSRRAILPEGNFAAIWRAS